jgi:hypothetical protein
MTVVAGQKFSDAGASQVAFGSNSGVFSIAGTAGFGIFFTSGRGNGFDESVLYFGYDDNGAGSDDNHDDMIVSARFTPVPEPATLAMWGIGALGMMFAGRRRRQLKLDA